MWRNYDIAQIAPIFPGKGEVCTVQYTALHITAHYTVMCALGSVLHCTSLHTAHSAHPDSFPSHWYVNSTVLCSVGCASNVLNASFCVLSFVSSVISVLCYLPSVLSYAADAVAIRQLLLCVPCARCIA